MFLTREKRQKCPIFNLNFRVWKIWIMLFCQLFIKPKYLYFYIRFSDLRFFNLSCPKSELKNRTFSTFFSRQKCPIFYHHFRVSKIGISKIWNFYWKILILKVQKQFSNLIISNFWYPKSKVKNNYFDNFTDF